MTYPGQEFDETWKSLVIPSNYCNPVPEKSYNLLVVGAGPAGLICAIGAAGLGAKVALLEKNRMGGDCLNYGCIPSKALLSASERALSFTDAMAFLRKVRSQISAHDSVARYADAGVDVFLGKAKFCAEREIEIEGQSLRAKKIAICTGSRPRIPSIPGLTKVSYFTNENIFELNELPEKLVIIGGGAIACELASCFARFGSAVTIIEVQSQILPGVLKEAGSLLRVHLGNLGVEVLTGMAVQGVSSLDGGLELIMENKRIKASHLLIASGRKANMEDLNLEAAGVKVGIDDGVLVNHRLRTSNKSIYAAGDVCSAKKFTHNADMQARILIQNALFMGRASTRGRAVPSCIYTRLEVACIGVNSEYAAREIPGAQIFRVNFSDLDRCKTEDDLQGFAEIVVAKKGGQLLGATIVGKQAGELIACFSLLMNKQLGITHLNNIILAYPTRVELLRRFADAYNKTRLTPGISKWMKRWLRWIN